MYWRTETISTNTEKGEDGHTTTLNRIQQFILLFCSHGIVDFILYLVKGYLSAGFGCGRIAIIVNFLSLLEEFESNYNNINLFLKGTAQLLVTYFDTTQIHEQFLLLYFVI